MKVNFFFKKIIALILSLCLLLCCSCSKAKKTDPPTKACRLLDEYTANYFDRQMLGSGLNLQFFLNDTSKYSNAVMSLGDYSYEDMKNSERGWISEINSLKTIPYEQLDVTRKQTYDVLLDYFQRKLDFSDFCICSQDLSPTLGIQSQLPVLLSEYRFLTKTDIENYFSLLKSVPNYFDGLCRFQDEKARQNCFINKDTCLKTISQCKDFLDQNSLTNNILVTSFSTRLSKCDFLSPEEKKEYINSNNQIICDYIFPSYQKLIDTLTTLMKNGHCDNINGLYSLKNGKEYYEYLVHDYTGSSKSIPEIKADIQQALLNDVRGLHDILSNNPEVLNDLDAPQSIQSPASIIKDLQQKMAADFTSLKNLSYEFKIVDENLQDYLSPAFYITPPLDNNQNNIIYLNPKKTDTLYTVLAHEGLPGHMYQNAFFSATSPDHIRYLTDCGGYSEGWAVYAELFSYKYQFENASLAEAHRINSSFSLALYCLCDIGVNYEGWDLSNLKLFLKDYNITDSSTCKSIFQAVIEDPANYLKYYLGYLQILELRDYVKEQIGNDFDLKKFHNALLTIGPAGFDVIKKWILYEYAR